jgi:hypothetical protein
MAKGRKTYRSMRGKSVDMDLLMKKNELTPAVGNAKVNARGDQLGPGGSIVKKREDLVREYYDVAGKVKQSSGAPQVAQPDATEETEVVAKKTSRRTTKKVEPEVELTAEEQDMMDEAAVEDQWIEDENGNFIKKDS